MNRFRWTLNEEKLLVEMVNITCEKQTGRIDWKLMMPIGNHTLAAMETRWHKNLKPEYTWNGTQYLLTEQTVSQGYRTRREDVQEYLKENPNEKPKVIAEKLGLNINTVYSARREAALKSIGSDATNTTTLSKRKNAVKTPQIKRVKVSRSFLWGAIKYERYE